MCIGMECLGKQLISSYFINRSHRFTNKVSRGTYFVVELEECVLVAGCFGLSCWRQQAQMHPYFSVHLMRGCMVASFGQACMLSEPAESSISARPTKIYR